MTPGILPAPGLYVLSRDVENRGADRRVKHDWRRQATFPKGLRLVVQPWNPDPSLNCPPRDVIEIHAYRGYISQYLLVRPEDIEASGDSARSGWAFELLRAMEPETGPERVFSGVHGGPEPENAYTLLCKLVEMELLSEADISKAWAALQSDWEAE